MSKKNTNGRQRTTEERRKASRRQKRIEERNRSIALILLCVFCLLFLVILGMLLLHISKSGQEERMASLSGDFSGDWEGAPPIDVQLLTVNSYSRPGTPIDSISGIVIHYTANPGASAMENRNYFENLKDTQDNKVSSHFVVGMEGEIVQCIPSSEVAYASNSRNNDTLSIECCHPDESGEFTDATYESVVWLTGWLCSRFDISVENVIRHYDVTGKNCPKYYVEHPDAWAQMKADIQAKIEEIDAL